MKLEPCVKVVNFNSRKLVVIKEPGSSLSPQGEAIKKIECSVPEAIELIEQLWNELQNEKVIGSQTR